METRKLFIGHATRTPPRVRVEVVRLPPGWGREAALSALRAGASITDPAAASIVAEFRAEQVAAAKRARAVYERGQHEPMPPLTIKNRPRVSPMPPIAIGAEARAHTAAPRVSTAGVAAMPPLKIGDAAPKIEQRRSSEMPALPLAVHSRERSRVVPRGPGEMPSINFTR